VIFGDGDQTRDFTFISDVVAANLLAAGAPVDSSVCVNVGGGRPTTINRLAGMIRELVGSGLPVSHAAQRLGDVAHSTADLTLSQSRIGYRPSVELKAGLERSRPHYVECVKRSHLVPGPEAGRERNAG
jgi:nucleoside-diphosphate-sugar epimerase